MHPLLFRSASSCVWLIKCGLELLSAARSDGNGIRIATKARHKLTARIAHAEAVASHEKIVDSFSFKFIPVFKVNQADPEKS